MNFALPAAFAWAALAVPIVVFYILKIRLRRVPVSTTIFWRQIFDEKQPRSLWQRLRHWLSLLAQLLLLLLLVLALTDPSFLWEILQAQRVVLVLDNSASMNATDVAPTRLAQARQIATRAIASLRMRDEMAIVAAGSKPQVVCGFTSHQRTLRDKAESIPASDGPTRVQEAIELSRRLIGDHPRGRVVILTDGCFEDTGRNATGRNATGRNATGANATGANATGATQAQAAATTTDTAGASQAQPPATLTTATLTTATLTTATLPPATETPATQPTPKLEWHIVAKRTGNVGITRWQVRRSLIDPVGYEILAEVTNLSDESVECRLEIDLNDRPVDVIPLQLTAEQVWSHSLEKTSTDGGKLTARLNRSDALAADNVAWALLPKRERQKVVLVTQGNLFLQKAIEANQLVELQVLKEAPASYDRQSIYFFHRQTPEKIPNANVFVIDPANSCDVWKMGDKLANPIVTKQDQDSPLMRHVRLDNVLLPDARQLQPATPLHVLVQALSGDPLYASLERPSGKILALTVNLDEGDLTFRTAFPIMITNALAWFAGQSAELRESLATGAVTEVELPRDASNDLLLRSPTGSVARRSASSLHDAERRATMTIGPLDQCGIWSIVPELKENKSKEPPAPLVELACNLANRGESDLRVPENLLTQSQASINAGWLTHPIWFYLVALAWMLSTVEWWLYQRRWLG